MDGLIRGLRDEFLKVVVSFFRSKGREGCEKIMFWKFFYWVVLYWNIYLSGIYPNFQFFVK